MSHSTRSLGDVARAPVWINLPLSLHDSELTFLQFHRLLKMHLVLPRIAEPIATVALRAPYVRTYLILIYAVVGGFGS